MAARRRTPAQRRAAVYRQLYAQELERALVAEAQGHLIEAKVHREVMSSLAWLARAESPTIADQEPLF